MPKINVRINGEIIDPKSYSTDLKYFDIYIEFLKNFSESFLKIHEIEPEINLVEYGTLGNELCLDSRLKVKLIKDFKTHLNNLFGIALYSSGTHADMLKRAYKDHKILYICLRETHDLNIIRTTLHEFYHLIDPFKLIEFQTIINGSSTYIKFKDYIKCNIRLCLNEYHASLRSYQFILQTFLKQKRKNQEVYLEVLIFRSKSHLSGLENKLSRKLKELKKERLSDYKVQYKLLRYFMEDFMVPNFYFFGEWRAFRIESINDSELKQAWNQFHSKINNKLIFNLLEKMKHELLREDKGEYESFAQKFDNYFTNFFNELILLFNNYIK